jgi:hypothetical protein
MVCAGSAQSAEFRPYELPAGGQQKAVMQEQRAKPETGKVVDEKAYTDFQSSLAGMTPEKKSELRAYFSKKRDQAREQQEYRYYSRLIEILDKK